MTTFAAQQAVGLIVLYIVLLFVLPSGQDGLRSYHLTNFELKVVHFAISLPVLLVWLAAFLGFASLRQYAIAIRKTPEGEYFARLADGVTWLAWSLPIAGLATLILNSMANQWPGFQPTSVIITNYINLLFPLIAFSIIGVASRGLVIHANVKLGLAAARLIIIVFLIAGVLYCYLTFRHFDLSNLGTTNNPYYLPIWLMVLTVIVPYLYAWFVGILSSYEITLLSRQVRGVLYRRPLQWLAVGLATIIVSSIALQYVNGIYPRGGHLVLDYRLVINVLFRIVGGAGFIILAIGAARLKKIEDV
ncbi:MAG TPA: hypothetical protein VLG27_00575 [Candidatus Saccharimonadia bacterium]|nr:hypothetical protein [Candidatus Saccharimonadia bacterium]